MVEDYKNWVKSSYNTSITAGVLGIALGLERIIHKDFDNALFIGTGFAALSLVGLALGYLIELENKK